MLVLEQSWQQADHAFVSPTSVRIPSHGNGSRARITDVGGQNDGVIEGQTPAGRRAPLNQSWAATSAGRKS